MRCECVMWAFPKGLKTGQHHHEMCPKFNAETFPRLFVYEDALDSWVPIEDSDSCCILDALENREEREIRVQRIDMTDKAFLSLGEQPAPVAEPFLKAPCPFCTKHGWTGCAYCQPAPVAQAAESVEAYTLAEAQAEIRRAFLFLDGLGDCQEVKTLRRLLAAKPEPENLTKRNIGSGDGAVPIPRIWPSEDDPYHDGHPLKRACEHVWERSVGPDSGKPYLICRKCLDVVEQPGEDASHD